MGIKEVSGNGNNIIENGENIEVSLLIQNTGQGSARDVLAMISIMDPNIVALTPTMMKQTFPTLLVGESKIITFNISVNYEYKGTDLLPITLVLSEKYQEYGGSYPLNLEMKKVSLNTSEINIADEYEKDLPIQKVSLNLDIDIEKNLPITNITNPNAVAFVIGICDYLNSDIPKVEYAKRDAKLMREYLVKVLGYNPKNILPQNPDELMTIGNMKNILRQKLPSYLKPDGNSDLFVYYTGHGAPSTTTQQPFFVPYDCDPNYVSDDNAYRMSDFYSDIAKLNAKKKIIIIDACFSGQSGDGKSIINNASPILLKVANPLLANKETIVFQSSESNQVSNWYPEKKHGMFTYFFLKGLKGEADFNQDGNISVGELENFINDENANLPYISQREMQRKQRAVVLGDKNEMIIGK